MTPHDPGASPSTPQLWKATALALAAAAVILVIAVLPAEYGIDPTGVGQRLGLTALASDDAAAQPSASAAEPASAMPVDGNTALAAQAAAVFGAQAGQSFDADAVAGHPAAAKTETLTLTLPPGKGAEVKALLDGGDGFVFHWTASGEVAVDMHGERPEVQGEYTSYAIEGGQREAAGRFVAPFAGQHGWYWLNRGQQPVTVEVTVTGFQKKLFRPGHPG